MKSLKSTMHEIFVNQEGVSYWLGFLLSPVFLPKGGSQITSLWSGEYHKEAIDTPLFTENVTTITHIAIMSVINIL